MASKNIIITLFAALPFMAQAQHDYIECSGTVLLYSGSIERYSSPDIYVDATYQTIREAWVATLQVMATGATTEIVKTYQIEFTDAEIDAFTASGSTTTEKLKNCVLQAVEDYLSTLNGGTTFTLH